MTRSTTTASSVSTNSKDSRRHANEWTPEEHAKYLESLVRFPNGPWKARAAFIGTRTTRQVMTHYQKITLRLKRHARGLLSPGRPRGATRKAQDRKCEQVAPQVTMPASPAAAIATQGLTCSSWEPQSPVSPTAAAAALDASFAGDVVFDPIPWELLEWEAFGLVV